MSIDRHFVGRFRFGNDFFNDMCSSIYMSFHSVFFSSRQNEWYSSVHCSWHSSLLFIAWFVPCDASNHQARPRVHCVDIGLSLFEPFLVSFLLCLLDSNRLYWSAIKYQSLLCTDTHPPTRYRKIFLKRNIYPANQFIFQTRSCRKQSTDKVGRRMKSTVSNGQPKGGDIIIDWIRLCILAFF